MRAIRLLAALLPILVAGLLPRPGAAQTLAVLDAATPVVSPAGVVVDSAGNLYVLNGYGPGGIGPSVLQVTAAGAVSTLYTNPASAGLTQFTALAFDGSGNLYLADATHSQVLRVTPGGVRTVLVGSSNGIAAPAGLAFDGSFNLYISNAGANTITKVTAGGAVSLFVGSGAGLNAPGGLAFDAGGNLYVANAGANAISKVSAAGAVSSFVGSGAGLSQPQALALDPFGNLLEADAGGTIHAITPAGVVSTVDSTNFLAPRGLAFDLLGDLIVADQRANSVSRVAPPDTVTVLLRGSLADPQFPAFDSAGNLYVANYAANTISKIAPNGTSSVFVAAGQGLSGPTGLAYRGGTLYVANYKSSSIVKVSAAGSVSSFVSGSASLVKPEGLAFDSAGNLYAATDGGTVAKIGSGGGVGSFVGTGLSAPRGLAFDGGGNLYVANSGSNTISKVTPAGAVSLFAAGLSTPFGLAFDGAGNLYAANLGGGSVFAIAPSGAVSVAVENSAGATTPLLVAPLGLAFDSSGRLDVADIGSHSILQIGFAASPVAAAVLPGARSVELGNAATVFATMINASGSALNGCGIGLSALAPAGLTMSFQTTDPTTNNLTGTINTPVTLAGKGSQSFVLAFQSSAALSAPGLLPVFYCQNVTPAALVPGVDTVDLTFSTTPIADIIALAAVTSDDGTVHIANGGGFFAVATVDAGAAAVLTVSADTGAASLPLALALCQTNASGQCLAPPAAALSVSFAANATPTFSIFVDANGTIPLDPANSRIFVRFKDAGGASHGSTSVAVTTS